MRASVEEEMSGGEAGRGGAEERKRGGDGGEKCLERGSGVRDWKTEEARKLHSAHKAAPVCLTLGLYTVMGNIFSL